MNLDDIESSYANYDDQIKHIKTVDEQDAAPVPAFDVLHPSLEKDFPFDHLYEHQADGLEQLERGENICITTPTSSGKTLIYGLFMLDQIRQDEDATFVLAYPTKALSRDQKTELGDLYSNFDIDIDIGVYDGDTETEEKRRIRRESNLIITNMQGLNYYLPHHNKWSRIFSNIKGIVIDESHTYTGVKGMHVSWIIRRLRRIIENKYNNDPQFILSSATIGNPQEHAYNLTGKEYTIINTDGSPQGKRDIVIWNPPSYTDDNGQLNRKSANKESSDLLAYLITKDIQSLLFARSRKMTELCSKWTEDSLIQMYNDYQSTVEPYNAGHRKSERRRVEDKLKEGSIDGVVSTNALELGIDIGGVDATLMNGYPGRKASFWQQAGRSGRGGSDALSILVARHASVDQYIVNNPEFLLESNVENAVVDLDNNKVLSQHLLCAANEYPLHTEDAKIFGEHRFNNTVQRLLSEGILRGDLVDGVTYVPSNRPEATIDLYSTENTQYTITVDLGYDTFNLPDVGASRAYRDYHPNAIHIHKGEQYQVTEFDQDEQEIVLEPVDVNYYTQSSRTVDINNIVEEESVTLSDGVKICRGRGEIEEYYNTYSRIYFDDSSQEPKLPTGIMDPVTLETELMWLSFDHDIASDIDREAAVDGLMGSLHAMEHGLIKMAPTVITADSKNIGGLSVDSHTHTNKPTVFIYDGIEGGVGFSHEIYNEIAQLSDRTEALLANCECTSDHGCPACTMSPMCGDNNEPMDSVGAQYILDVLSE